jgi:hypothetical protein
VDGARAALAVVASLLRSSQMQMFAETIEQRRAPIDSQIVFLSVYTQRDGNFSGRSPSAGAIGPAEANKLAMPKRERKVRRVDFPNSRRLSSGFSSLSL